LAHGFDLAASNELEHGQAGTEAIQRKEEKYDLATIAHDRVIQRQFLVIGQGPWAAAIIEHALDFDGRYGVHTARRR
jgi:hypothetical protein